MTVTQADPARFVKPSADDQRYRRDLVMIAKVHILDGRHLPNPVQFALHSRLTELGVTELVGVAREAVDRMNLIFPTAGTHESMTATQSAINLTRSYLHRIHPEWKLDTHKFDLTLQAWVELDPEVVTEEARGFALAMVWFHHATAWAATKYEQNKSLFV